MAASPALDPTIETVVCIPCFRRPQYLRRTLESLAAQRTSRRFAVVMVENDASKSESVPVAAEYLASGKFAGLCVIEPRQGNCHAINAAFETGLAQGIVFERRLFHGLFGTDDQKEGMTAFVEKRPGNWTGK